MNPSKEIVMYVNSTFTSGSALAHAAVTRAVHKGFIPAAKTLVCVDCGSPATCYDHRDYSHPLSVEPVCSSCNRIRGKALPKAWASLDEFKAYMTKCKSVKWQSDWHGFNIERHATPLIAT